MTGLGFKGYAHGAIKTRNELLDLIIEARKEKKAIRLYAVTQGGYFNELFLTSKSKIDGDPDLEKFYHWQRSPLASERFWKTHSCLGDLNIGRGGHNRHQLFANRRLALAYSEQLKADAEYQSAVKEWHRRCDTLFGGRWAS